MILQSDAHKGWSFNMGVLASYRAFKIQWISYCLARAGIAYGLIETFKQRGLDVYT